MISGEEKKSIEHGGSLARAKALFPEAPEPWIDLSTGINPHSYPLFDLPATAFSRLPEQNRIDELAALAAGIYGVASTHSVVPAPGTQILLPRVAALVPPGEARVLGPTYAEHARAAALAGHSVSEVGDFADLAGARLAVVVNPNNPDGRIASRADLLALAGKMRSGGGLLIVDEAFMEVGPRGESVAGDVGEGGLVVLKSFGKFFGMAGVRLGFALSSKDHAETLAAGLGPWSVAGPALEIGLRALGDRHWQDEMRQRLTSEAARLDALLAPAGIVVTGGTALFRFIRHDAAPSLHDALGRRGIITRRFEGRPDVLRIGLPAGEIQWKRLSDAIAGWRGQGET